MLSSKTFQTDVKINTIFRFIHMLCYFYNERIHTTQRMQLITGIDISLILYSTYFLFLPFSFIPEINHIYL